VVILRHKIYVIGGVNDDGLLTTIDRFHLRSQKWKEMPGLLEPRFSFGVATWAGSIFVFGGRSDQHCLKSMELCRPKGEKRVSSHAQLNEARAEFSYVVYENQIYCFGGRGVNSVECYEYLNEQRRIVGKVGTENNYSIDCIVYPPVN